MAEPEPSEALAAFDRVLDRLLTVMQAREPDRLGDEVRAYVEDAIEAAMGAAGRARDSPIARDQGISQVEEALRIAAALLEELRATGQQAAVIVERSLELRRKAIHLTAAALTLTSQAERLRAVSTARPDVRRTGTSTGALHGVRVLLVGDGAPPEANIEGLLAAVGAQARVAGSVPEAVRVARALHPDVVVCDVSFPAAEGLIVQLRRRGVIAPALSLRPAADARTRAAAREAGFADVLVRPLTPAVLVRAVRAVLGA